MNVRNSLFVGTLGTVIAVAGLTLSATPAHAQLGGLLGKKSSSSASEGSVSGEQLVKTFRSSQGHVVSAQASFAEALGLKDEAAKLQAEQKALSSGQMDTDALKKTRSVTSETQAAIDASIAKQPQLSAESKKKFSDGLVEYFKSVVGARELSSQAQGYTKGASANPMGMMGKGSAAIYVGKETPGYVKDLVTTGKSLLSFAKSNNIQAPANATAALDGL